MEYFRNVVFPLGFSTVPSLPESPPRPSIPQDPLREPVSHHLVSEQVGDLYRAEFLQSQVRAMENRRAISRRHKVIDALKKFQVQQDNIQVSMKSILQQIKDVSQKFQEWHQKSLENRATTKQEKEPKPKSEPDPEPEYEPEPEFEPESEPEPTTEIEPTLSRMMKPGPMSPPETYDPFLRSLPSQTLKGVNVVLVDLRPTRQYRHRGHVVHVSCSGHVISADMDMMALIFSQPRWMIVAIRSSTWMCCPFILIHQVVIFSKSWRMMGTQKQLYFLD